MLHLEFPGKKEYFLFNNTETALHIPLFFVGNVFSFHTLYPNCHLYMDTFPARNKQYQSQQHLTVFMLTSILSADNQILILCFQDSTIKFQRVEHVTIFEAQMK